MGTFVIFIFYTWILALSILCSLFIFNCMGWVYEVINV